MSPIRAPVAAIDLGSNSVKLTIARVHEPLEVLEERTEITRIGEGLDQNGALLAPAMERTLAALESFAERARALGVTEIRAVGTAGLRGASNAGAFLARVKERTGIEVEVIHGLREAELAFGAASGTYGGSGAIVVADVGGRSTEVILGSAGQLADRVSLEIGAVRITERFLLRDPPAEDELARAAVHIADALGAAPDAAPGTRVVGVSGTIMSLIGVQLGLDDMGETVRRGEGLPLLRSAVVAAYEELRAKPAAARIRGSVLPAGRADVIVAGAQIVLALMDRYGADSVIATQRGVRYGLLLERR